MDDEEGQEAAGPQVQEGGVGAEQGGVAELQERAQQAGDHGHVGVRDPELVEVVEVGEPEYDGREKDRLRDRCLRCQHQRHGGRPEEHLLGERALGGEEGPGQRR